MNETKINPKKRHKARRFLIQALYQWQLTGNDVSEVILTFLMDMNTQKTDAQYFRAVMQAIPTQLSELDASFEPYLDRPLAEIGPIELAVLRLGAYELLRHPELPYKVVVNEAIELAKTFGPEDSYKYINSILDKVARQFRSIELTHGQ